MSRKEAEDRSPGNLVALMLFCSSPADAGWRCLVTLPRMSELVFRVADLADEVRFWEEAIGLPRVRPKPGEPIDRLAIIDLGGPRLELHGGGSRPEAPESRGQVSGAPILVVDDAEAALATALAAGARQVMPLQDVPPNGRFVYILSPNNLPVGLVQGDDAAYRAMLGMRPLPEYWS